MVMEILTTGSICLSEWHIWHMQNDIYKKSLSVNQTMKMPVKFAE